MMSGTKHLYCQIKNSFHNNVSLLSFGVIMIELVVRKIGGEERVETDPEAVVIAGWTGRNEAALNAHIKELAELGIAPPKSVPMFYRVATTLLTTRPVLQMAGREATGEVETVLWKHDGCLYVGVGSDHTDRKLETVGITLSKQLCAKPVSQSVWPWAEVAPHWDQIILRSRLASGDIYQEGPVAGLRRPDELLALYESREGSLPAQSLMFCGTLAVHGGIRFADEMTLELVDPVLRRMIEHRYTVDVLPIAEA
jgi:hypothetical protein